MRTFFSCSAQVFKKMDEISNKHHRHSKLKKCFNRVRLHSLLPPQGNRGGGREAGRGDSHVWTELVKVPVTVLLHLLRGEDGQGLVGVHGDHHAADVCLQEEGEKHRSRGEPVNNSWKEFNDTDNDLCIECQNPDQTWRREEKTDEHGCLPCYCFYSAIFSQY